MSGVFDWFLDLFLNLLFEFCPLIINPCFRITSSLPLLLLLLLLHLLLLKAFPLSSLIISALLIRTLLLRWWLILLHVLALWSLSSISASFHSLLLLIISRCSLSLLSSHVLLIFPFTFIVSLAFFMTWGALVVLVVISLSCLHFCYTKLPLVFEFDFDLFVSRSELNLSLSLCK